MKINIKINMKMTMKIIIKKRIKAIGTNIKLMVKMNMMMIIKIRAPLDHDHCHFEGKIRITISSVLHLLLQSSATVQRGLSYPSICRQNI